MTEICGLGTKREREREHECISENQRPISFLLEARFSENTEKVIV